MEVINVPSKCAIQIVYSQTDLVVTADVTSVRVKRQLVGKQRWDTIKTITVSTLADLDFTLCDYSVKAKHDYRYMVAPVVGSTEQVGTMSDVVRCDFDGVFIGNSANKYVCALDAKCEMKMRYAMTYVQPLYSPFPHSISNGNMKHCTGTMSGLFLPFDANGNPTAEGSEAYKEAVLDFLTDGSPKLLKRNDGRSWGVQIDTEPSEVWSDFYGASTISFNWTEVQAADELTEGLVVVE